MIKAFETTAVETNAILPAVVVENMPVGIRMIEPPFVEIGEGAVIVAIDVVPETKAIGVVGAIVVAEAIVGAPEVVPFEVNPKILVLPLRLVVDVAPDTAEPMFTVVVEPDNPAVPMLIVLEAPEAVAPE